MLTKFSCFCKGLKKGNFLDFKIFIYILIYYVLKQKFTSATLVFLSFLNKNNVLYGKSVRLASKQKSACQHPKVFTV